MTEPKYQIVENPSIRIPTIEGGRMRDPRTTMIGLLEADITLLRETIRALRKQDITFSFTACIIKIIADCVAENKIVQASLRGDHKLVLFNDVDVCISIERELNGGYYPYPYIIRAADKKSVVAISQEIDEQINRTVSADDDLYLKNRSKADQRMVKFMLALPSKLRVMLMETMVRNPFRHKQIFGTVGFATVNITGRLSAWVFPNKNAHSLYIALGSITKKPVVVKNEVQVREVLNITAIFDHNVIDGTPARSFMNALVDTIEKGLIEVS